MQDTHEESDYRLTNFYLTWLCCIGWYKSSQ